MPSSVGKSSQLILGIASLASGAALLVAIFAQTTLSITLPLLGVFAGLVFFLKYTRGSCDQRIEIKTRVKTGLIGGILATLAYDSFRLALVRLLGFSFAPLGALPVFGRLLLGAGASARAAWIAGTIYHYLNGITFAIAYCFAFGGRNWKWGIAWAMALEIAMFTVYPGWLHIGGMMEEFTMVSLSGHIAYGVVLGVVSQRHLKRLGEHSVFRALS